MKKISIKGNSLSYIRSGRGNPLVLIHGYPLDHTIWDMVVPLLDQKFDLIIPDLSGFGESDVSDHDPSMIDYATDIEELLNQLNISKAFIGGHSMGGYVGLAFAREFGERLSGLVMISSQTLSDSPDRKEARRQTAKQVGEKGVAMVAETMVSKLSTNRSVQEFVGPLIARQQPKGIINALNAMADRPDLTKLFKTFKFPVTIIHGDADQLIPVDRGREMKAVLPSAHYFEMSGLGHLAMMEDANNFVQAFDSLVNI